MLRGRAAIPELTEKLTESIANAEVGDDWFEDNRSDNRMEIPWLGVPVALETVVLFLMTGLTMSYGIAFQVRPELYSNGTSTLSFPKRYLTLNNSLYITKGSVAAENNGDTFNVATLLQTSIWLAFAAYAVADIWSFLVFWYRNPKVPKVSPGDLEGEKRKKTEELKDKRTLWGINHFSLYLVSIVSDVIRWSILVKLMGYDEYLSYGFCYFMVFAVATTSFLVALLHQYFIISGVRSAINPVFVGFGVVMVCILLALSLAFTSQIFIANHAQQTSLTNQKYEQTKAMFISLMFWLCFRIAAIVIKMILSLLEITCNSFKNAERDVKESISKNCQNFCGKYTFKILVEILEHLVWFSTMVVFDVSFFVYYSKVAW